jgi:hypothetical protein
MTLKTVLFTGIFYSHSPTSFVFFAFALMYCVPSLHFQGGCSLLGNKKDGNWKNFSCQLVHFFFGGGEGVGEGISVAASYIYNVYIYC